MRPSTSLVLLLASLVAARKIPAKVKSFYDSHIKDACPNPFSTCYDSGQGKADTVYCQHKGSGAVYLKDAKNGYTDMEINCDSLNSNRGDCSNDRTGQGQTALKDSLQKFGIENLDTHIHTYVALGNDSAPKEGDGGKSFHPQNSAGIKPFPSWRLCAEPTYSTVEASFSNQEIDGDKGHTHHDVLYIAFPGDEAVVGGEANWKTSTAKDFGKSLKSVGDKLVVKLG